MSKHLNGCQHPPHSEHTQMPHSGPRHVRRARRALPFPPNGDGGGPAGRLPQVRRAARQLRPHGRPAVRAAPRGGPARAAPARRRGVRLAARRTPVHPLPRGRELLRRRAEPVAGRRGHRQGARPERDRDQGAALRHERRLRSLRLRHAVRLRACPEHLLAHLRRPHRESVPQPAGLARARRAPRGYLLRAPPVRARPYPHAGFRPGIPAPWRGRLPLAADRGVARWCGSHRSARQLAPSAPRVVRGRAARATKPRCATRSSSRAARSTHSLAVGGYATTCRSRSTSGASTGAVGGRGCRRPSAATSRLQCVV